jgi:hypothetical protein
MKYNIVLLFFAMIFYSCNNEEQINTLKELQRLKESKFTQKLDSIEEINSKLNIKIDSLENSIKEERIKKKPKKSNQTSSNLEIPFFIGKTMKQVKDFWSTRISIQFFSEGTYDNSEIQYFDIMVSNIGTPLFNAHFENGKCYEHSTEIGFSDISVMQAKLMKGGYTYSNSCECWTITNSNHYWKIKDITGDNFLLYCVVKGRE